MLFDLEYKNWIIEIKSKIRATQMKAAMAVNATVIEFYWELGKMIAKKQTAWGTKFLDQLSKDLQTEFPDMKGFSKTNLKYCKLFYNKFPIRPQIEDELLTISPKPEDEMFFNLAKQIPWGHIKLIIDKVKDVATAQFYIQQTIENAWGRETLALQIKSQLNERKGKAISNFKNTLSQPMSDLAQQTLKDPYNFDFLAMDANMRERDLENQLVKHISKFLLELGKGFAIAKPIGVSEFSFTEILPEELKSSLPTIEELEQEFKNLSTNSDEN